MSSVVRRYAVRVLRGIAAGAARRAEAAQYSAAWLTRADRELIARNAGLRGIHSSRSAFVVGNGPSIRHQDLAPLAGHVTIVANAFWKHPLMNLRTDGMASAWQPRYYAMLDPLYTDGSAPMAAHFAQVRARAPDCVFFLTCEGCRLVQRHQLLPAERIRACAFVGNMTRVPEVRYDLTGVLPSVQSVSLFGILAALFMGCNPIYLLGLDHDWLSRPSVRCRHFYSGPSVEDHPEVIAIERQASLGYLANVEAVATLFKSYERVRELAAGLGVAIFNATRGGFLDVFPRVPYEDIVRRASALASGRVTGAGVGIC